MMMENPVDIREQSPLALAFVGDAVYELLVRSRLVRYHRMQPGKLHAAAVKYVSAVGQFRAVKLLEEKLTQQEQDVLRRGKNASKAAVAKHATPEEYRCSTGFEALLGWLYLQDKQDRVQELFDYIWENFDPEGPQA